MKKAMTICAAALTIGLASAAAAQPRSIHDPSKDVWSTQGKDQTSSVVKDSKAPGGLALRIRADKGENPWDGQAVNGISGDIHKGDVVVAAFYARVEKPPEGRQTGVISAQIGLAAAPYTPIAATDAFQIGPDWKMYLLSGASPVDATAGKANFIVHVARAKQVIDLGAVNILDLGPHYDLSKLPKNP